MNAVFKHPNQVAAERALERQGGFYTFADILEGVRTGHFQSFSYGESMAVTRIANFPRKTAIEVVFMVGAEEELRVLEDQILQFGRDRNVKHFFAYGRPGYTKKAFGGWSMVSSLFVKELKDG